MRKKPWRKWRQRRVGDTWRRGTGGRKGDERCKGEKTVRCTIRITRRRIGRNKGRCLTEKREAKCEREGR